ncbi:hypothetical protein ACFFU8_09505 [Chromobacterium piscinae]|uniref:hypothetical protein n=1 Tax=Chromobacterium piscinae TaxID=686831 RepID=UPI001E623770|nr:hypothetical protein [Chromobacterium piscinae]MCD5327860.1 hypothetical protein [Chromobacterium piscinae]
MEFKIQRFTHPANDNREEGRYSIVEVQPEMPATLQDQLRQILEQRPRFDEQMIVVDARAGAPDWLTALFEGFQGHGGHYTVLPEPAAGTPLRQALDRSRSDVAAHRANQWAGHHFTTVESSQT